MRPSRDEVLMHTAWTFAARGTCSRATVGAVISREGRILVTGYNGAPAGLDHCDHGDLSLPNGCRTAVHAECNAVAYAARHGVRLSDSELHSTRAPCTACSQIIINAGIKRVVYDEEGRDMDGIRLMLRAGLTVERFSDMISR